MNKFSKYAVPAIFILFLIIFTPRYMTDIEEIVQIEVNNDFGAAESVLTTVENYDEKSVITLLANYKEQRTLLHHGGFAEKDVQYRILARTKSGIREIILGKSNYNDKGGFFSCRIVHNVLLKKQLGELLNP